MKIFEGLIVCGSFPGSWLFTWDPVWSGEQGRKKPNHPSTTKSCWLHWRHYSQTSLDGTYWNSILRLRDYQCQTNNPFNKAAVVVDAIESAIGLTRLPELASRVSLPFYLFESSFMICIWIEIQVPWACRSMRSKTFWRYNEGYYCCFITRATALFCVPTKERKKHKL